MKRAMAMVMRVAGAKEGEGGKAWQPQQVWQASNGDGGEEAIAMATRVAGKEGGNCNGSKGNGDGNEGAG